MKETLRITGEEYEVSVEDEKEPDRGTCVLDTSTNPRRMTIKSTDDPNRGKTLFAIYEMKDANSMRVCYDLSGKEFPKDFKASKGTQLYAVGYRRQRVGFLAPSRSVALERLLPTPGFHLHVMKEGAFLIDGRKSNIPLLKNAMQSSFNMVDSASISILLSLEENARVPSDIRRLIVAPGIAVYPVRQVEVK